MIVMELVEGGSLLTFLRKNSATLDQQQMMGMCRDTAAGNIRTSMNLTKLVIIAISL